MSDGPGLAARAADVWWTRVWPFTGLAVGLLGAAVMSLGELPGNPLYGVQAAFFDYLLRDRPVEALDDPDDPIVLVGYDENAVKAFGQIPQRGVIDSAIRFVLAGEPAAVVIDYQFTQPDLVATSVASALREVETAVGSSRSMADAVHEVSKKYDQTSRLLRAISDDRVVGTFYPAGKTEAGPEVVAAPAFPPSQLDAQRCERFRGATELTLDRPEFLAAYRNYGSARQEPDPDGSIRRYPLFIRAGDGLYPSLALVAAALHAGFPANVECDPTTSRVVTGFSIGADTPADLAAYPDGRIWIDYGGSFAQSFPNWVPFAELFQGNVARERFAGKAVFLGPRSDYEDKYAMFGDIRFPGVAIHATVAHSLVTQRWLHRPWLLVRLWEPLTCVAAGLLVTLLFRRIQSSSLLLLAAAFLAAGYATSGAMLRNGWLVDALLPGIVGFSAVLICSGLKFVVEQRRADAERNRAEQERVRAEQGQLKAEAERLRAEQEQERRQSSERELGAFLSPAVAELVINNRTLLEPARKEITVLFSDIRSFTTISEGMAPEDLSELLREYLTWMTNIVLGNHGTLDKYIGDAVMALFGTPLPEKTHARWACTAALEMMEALDSLNEKWREDGRPELHIGIGINTGHVIVGKMGSEKKPEYTCIGDEVNFASRVEGLTKPYGASILVGDATRQQVGEDDFVFRDLGPVKVKGKTRGVRIHELVGTQSAIGDPPWLATFEQGLQAFLLREWDAAEKHFRRTIHERGGTDGPSTAFLELTRLFRAEPPDEAWDGSIERREK